MILLREHSERFGRVLHCCARGRAHSFSIAALTRRVFRAVSGALAGLGFAWSAWAEIEAFPEFTTANARNYLLAVAKAVQTQTGEHAEMFLLQARLQSHLGRQDEAERLARQALERAPNWAEPHAFLADLFIRQDRLTEAANCLQQALALNPGLAGGQRRLGMVLDRLGDRAGAREAFATAVRANAADATARLLFGRLLLDEGQAKDAALHLKKACQLDPELANAFYALSQAQSRLGDHADARQTLATFQKLKQKEKAALEAENAAYDDGQALCAVAAGFHTDAALFFRRLQQDALAEAHLCQAVRVSPQETLAYEKLAALYLKKARLSDARKVCQELVRLRPKNATYRVNLGALLLQLGEHPAAIEELKRALELDPNQPEALNNLARFYLGSRRDLPEALVLSRRLVSLQPTAAHYDLLGWAFYANGQIAEARAASTRAVELDPNNAVFRERNRRLLEKP